MKFLFKKLQFKFFGAAILEIYIAFYNIVSKVLKSHF